MATDLDFVEYVADQADLGARLTYRKMFGEYGIYLDGRFVAMACDNSLFLKPTRAIDDSGLELPSGPPYPGAKPHPVIDELLDDPERLRHLLVATAARVPEPTPKKPRKPSAR
jgi:TfoX/Sxy family transcriptional regulator of competence genes